MGYEVNLVLVLLTLAGNKLTFYIVITCASIKPEVLDRNRFCIENNLLPILFGLCTTLYFQLLSFTIQFKIQIIIVVTCSNIESL